MTEEQAKQLIQDSQYLVGKEITINFTDEKDQVKRTAICTVLNKTFSFGIGEDGEPKNYSVNILVQEEETDKQHSISLSQVVKAYPKETL